MKESAENHMKVLKDICVDILVRGTTLLKEQGENVMNIASDKRQKNKLATIKTAGSQIYRAYMTLSQVVATLKTWKGLDKIEELGPAQKLIRGPESSDAKAALSICVCVEALVESTAEAAQQVT